MTLEAAIAEVGALPRQFMLATVEQDALARVLAVARAFPKMLEALESLRVPTDETLDAVDDDRRSGTRMLPTSISLGDLKRINAALRAAREAVKP